MGIMVPWKPLKGKPQSLAWWQGLLRRARVPTECCLRSPATHWCKTLPNPAWASIREDGHPHLDLGRRVWSRAAQDAWINIPAEQKAVSYGRHLFEIISICPDVSGASGCFLSSTARRPPWLPGPSTVVWGWQFLSSASGDVPVSDLPVEGNGPVLALAGRWIYLGRETPSSHCAHLGRWGLVVYGDLENKDAWPIRGHRLWELGKKGCWALSREDGNQSLTQWQYCFHSTKQSSQVKVGMLIMCTLPNKRTMLSLKVLSGVWNTQTLLKNRDIVTFGNAGKYTIYSVRCFSVEKLNALKSQSLLSVRYITFVDIQRRRPKIMEILL